MAHAILLAHAEDSRKRAALRIRKRQLRARSAPMHLPEEEFILNFRLSKSTFKELVEELRPYMPSTRRSTAVRNDLKVLAALSFFAQGSYQKSVCASYLYCMSQPTFSKCLNEVINGLNTPELLQKYIKFPVNRQSRQVIMKNGSKNTVAHVAMMQQMNQIRVGEEHCWDSSEPMVSLPFQLSRLTNTQRYKKLPITTLDKPFGITDSLPCSACIVGAETAVHILLQCSSVADYRAKYLGVPRSLLEVFSKPRKRLSFLEKLGTQVGPCNHQSQNGT